MSQLWTQADAVLRARSWEGESRPRALLQMGILIFICGCGYGAVMGTFGGVGPERFAQIFYSAVKVPLLLLVTFLISLPSYFVLNTLMGVRGDFPVVLRALVATQSGLTVILFSLSPLVAVWYLSCGHYPMAILFNAGMFGIATFCAQHLLRRYYRPLIQRHSAHRRLLLFWLLTYAFVGIQLGWVLRPFVGAPGAPSQFFRSGAWSNAYVVLWEMIWGLFRH